MEPVLPFNVVPFDASIAESDDISEMTVEQYLSWVRHQADQLPIVSRAEIDVDRYKQNQTKYMPSVDKIDTCPDEFLPSVEWEDDTLSSFSDLRMTIGRYAQDESTRERKVTVPPLKDGRAWSIFCLGRDIDRADVDISAVIDGNEKSINPSGGDDRVEEFDDDIAGAHDDDIVENCDEQTTEDLSIETRVTTSMSGSGFPEWLGAAAVAPTTSVVLQFDQVMTQKLLSFHINWLERRFLVSDRARWIYALLARLEKPLYRDTVALIRQLYRVCCRQRCMLANADPRVKNNPLCEISVLNTLIAICGLYFGQAEHGRLYMEKAADIAEEASKEGDYSEELEVGTDSDDEFRLESGMDNYGDGENSAYLEEVEDGEIISDVSGIKRTGDDAGFFQEIRD